MQKKAGQVYGQIQYEINKIWKQDMLHVIGDLNVKVGDMKGENVVELFDLGTKMKENNLSIISNPRISLWPFLQQSR